MQQLQTALLFIDLTGSFSWDARQRWIINISGYGPSELCLKVNLSRWESLPRLESCGKHLGLSNRKLQDMWRQWKARWPSRLQQVGSQNSGDHGDFALFTGKRTPSSSTSRHEINANSSPVWTNTLKAAPQTTLYTRRNSFAFFWNLQKSVTNVAHIVGAARLWQIKNKSNFLGLWCCCRHHLWRLRRDKSTFVKTQPTFSSSQRRKWPTAGREESWWHTRLAANGV